MDDGELRQALNLVDAYRSRVETMTQQTQVLRMSLQEVSLALDAVRAFRDAKDDEVIMVPLGASCLIPVKVTPDRSVVTGIGSGISVQKTADEAIDYLEKNVAEITEALKTAMTSLNDAQQNLAAMSETVEQEYEARRMASQGRMQ